MPRVYGDGAFMMFESPESRVHLQEMCENKMIARLCLDLNEDLPAGSAGFGLEFETGERLAILALAVTEGPFLARLIWRWIPRQAIWTKSMRRHFGADRSAAGEEAPNFLQRQIEGQMIRGVLKPKDHVGLGERLDFELRDGSFLIVDAIPDLMRNAVDLDVRRERRERMVTHG